MIEQLGDVLDLVPSNLKVLRQNLRLNAVSLLRHLQYSSPSIAFFVFWITHNSRTLFDFDMYP